MVSKVYEFIQYTPQACFKTFVDLVSNARRDGDKDPDCAILAETMKLLGNCGYGKTVTNQMKFRSVQYAATTEASRLVNCPQFRQLNLIQDGIYEVELAKKKISLDLPHHIGFFVYQYAKHRMLEFYYDFLMVFVDPKDFQYIEMDTDSAYVALSASNLEEIIRLDKRHKFYSQYHLWFPSECCDMHRESWVEAKMAGESWSAPPCCQSC